MINTPAAPPKCLTLVPNGSSFSRCCIFPSYYYRYMSLLLSNQLLRMGDIQSSGERGSSWYSSSLEER